MVILLDKHKHPLGFTSEARARKMMEKGRACIYRMYPYTIIGMDLDAKNYSNIPTYRIKIDPGSATTGISVICNENNSVYLYMQIKHKGQLVVKSLGERKTYRHSRRSRECWSRPAKFGNEKVEEDKHKKYTSSRAKGWLPPSIRSVADNIVTWVIKLKRLIPITDCSFEAVRFDSQKLDDPEISGVQYQQGTLLGYEMKEYLLEKYQHVCQYCGGETGDPILEWEHMLPKSRGGSDSVKNATLACHTCNQAKDKLTPEEWLEKLQKENPKSRKAKDIHKARLENIPSVIEGKPVGNSNRYSSWVSTYRKYVEKQLYDIFGENHMECSSGGRTKYNRKMLGLPKDHHYDALCVGTVPDSGYTDLTGGYVLYAEAKGRGNRLRGQTNACGVIVNKYKDRSKRAFGFQTGDIVIADVPRGKYTGHHIGRISIRKNGNFEIKTDKGMKFSVNHAYCRVVQKTDGYAYRYAKPNYEDTGKEEAIPHGNELPCPLA